MRILVSCRMIDNIAGGVERQAVGLLNEMVRRGYDVHFFTWDQPGARAFYEMDKRVVWHKLGMGNAGQKAGWQLRFERLKHIRTLIKTIAPDVIVSFQHGPFLALRVATILLGIPVIASTRNAPSIFEYTSMGKQKNFVCQTMRLAKKITVQFEEYREGFPKYLRHKFVAVPNAIVPAKSYANPQGETGQKKILLTVGRLSYQKNYTALIRAFAKIAPDFPDWTLFIAGEGEDRKALEALVSDLDMKERIEMPGAISNVSELYCKAHLFCLPSLWEGFPNALAESFSHGLPAIGLQSCEGVNALIEDGVNGLLVQNTHLDNKGDCQDALSDSLIMLMNDDARRQEMGYEGVKTMRKYAPEKVYDIWQAAIESALPQKRRTAKKTSRIPGAE